MAQYKEKKTGDVVTVHGPVAEWYDAQPNWEAVITVDPGESGKVVALETLDELTKPELLDIADREKVNVKASDTKDQILTAIKAKDNPSVAAVPVTTDSKES